MAFTAPLLLLAISPAASASGSKPSPTPAPPTKSGIVQLQALMPSARKPNTMDVKGSDGKTITQSSQCSKPLSQRIGGWACFTDPPPASQAASPLTQASGPSGYCLADVRNTCWYTGSSVYGGRFSQNNVEYGYYDQNVGQVMLGYQQSSASYTAKGWQTSGRYSWKATRGEINIMPTIVRYEYNSRYQSSSPTDGTWSGYWGAVNANTTESSVWTVYANTGLSGWYYDGFAVDFNDAEFPGTWGITVASALIYCNASSTVVCDYPEGATPPANPVSAWYSS